MNDGKNFERLVGEVLRLKGSTVETEQLVGTKKVDLIVDEKRWGNTFRIAVECKDEGRPLPMRRLAAMWAEYEPLYQANLVNEVLIVTRVPPAPTALAWVRQTNGLSTMTLDQLKRQVLDTAEYLQTMSEAFDNSPGGLSRYYQQPTTASGEPLTEMIDCWIEGTGSTGLDSNRPVAILGAYGIGKSTFATNLASRLARKALADPAARIPILIRLGEIARQQKLDGLLGAHLASTHEVPGYNFSRFMKMNKSGNFVVILDGLDEMKHLISWHEFLYNLTELKQLVDGDSRVVILGRPTAFENDAERVRAFGNETRTEIDSQAQVFQEIEMAPFGPGQIKKFIDGFSDVYGIGDDDREKIQSVVRLAHFQDIARRPVQLWMLAMTIPDYEGRLEQLDLPKLYEYVIKTLIEEVIEREMKKESRLGFDAATRRSFLQDLAFWMWTVPGGFVTSYDEIDDALVSPYASNQRDIPRVRRELILGSPLDKPLGDKLKFPHRSFQEYLVAAECLERIRCESLSIQEYDRLATDEVADFVRSLIRESDIATARANAGKHRGAISWRTVHSLLLHESVPVVFERSGTDNGRLLWGLLLRNARAVEASQQTLPDEESIRQALRLSDPADYETPLLAMFIVLAGSGGRQLGVRQLALLQDVLDTLIHRGPLEHFTRATLKAMGEQRVMTQTRQRTRGGRRQDSQFDIRTFGFSTFGGGLALIPIDENYVGDLRGGSERLGKRVSGGQLIRPVQDADTLDILGKTTLELRWISPVAISVCRAVGNDGRFDGRSAVRALLPDLKAAAFVSTWAGPNGLLPSIRLAPPVALNRALSDEMTGLASAAKKYATEWARRR